MTRIGYPSEDFPNPVPFHLEIPDDWTGLHVPQTLVAARGPEPVDGYRANVIVAWQRMAADGDVEQLARALVKGMADASDRFDVESVRSGEAAGLPVVALESSLDDGRGNTLAQRHLVVAGPVTTHRTRDLFHVAGSYDVDDDAGGRSVGEILRSFVVIDPTELAVSPAA